MSDVDWTKPIEFVFEGGAPVPAAVAGIKDGIVCVEWPTSATTRVSSKFDAITGARLGGSFGARVRNSQAAPSDFRSLSVEMPDDTVADQELAQAGVDALRSALKPGARVFLQPLEATFMKACGVAGIAATLLPRLRAASEVGAEIAAVNDAIDLIETAEGQIKVRDQGDRDSDDVSRQLEMERALKDTCRRQADFDARVLDSQRESALIAISEHVTKKVLGLHTLTASNVSQTARLALKEAMAMTHTNLVRE